MITGLHLGNFKAFAETQHIPIKLITLIFGANSSGKSSIIQGLLWAREAQETGNLDVDTTRLGGNFINLGGFERFVHRRDTRSSVQWGADVEIRNLKDVPDELASVIRHIGITITAGLVSQDSATLPAVQSFKLTSSGSEVAQFVRARNQALQERLFQKSFNFDHPDFGAMLTRRFDSFYSFDEGEDTITIIDGGWDGDPVTVHRSSALDLYNLRRDEDEEPEEYWSLSEDELRSAARGPGRIAYYSDQFAPVRADEQIMADYLDLKRQLLMKELWSGQPFLRRGRNPWFLPKYEPSDSDHEMAHKTRRTGAELVVTMRMTTILMLLIRKFTEQLENTFRRLQYLGPVRGYPQRAIIIPEIVESGRGNSVEDPWIRILRDAELRSKVNRWLGAEVLQTPYHFDVRRYMLEGDSRSSLAELILNDIRLGTEVDHRNVGFGISQVVPVLVAAYGSDGSIIAIEQPEIHLHPKLQAELGDVFIESALGERKNTFLLETHSEHLILRIMRRMRDTARGTLPEGLPPVRPEDVAILYVQPKADNSSSVVTVLELDEEGQLLDPWPGGFFEEGFNERFA